QKDASVLNPNREDIYDIGTVVNIIQMLRLPDSTVKVLIEGKYRAAIKDFENTARGYRTTIERCNDELGNVTNVEASVRGVKNIFEQYVKVNKRIPPELLMSISSITDPSRLADIIVAHLSMKIAEKQEILKTIVVEERLQLLLEKMQAEIEIINVEKRIRTRVKNQMEKSQKEYYLNEQMNAIQKELGSGGEKSETQEMEEALKKKIMPEEAKKKTEKEIKKLKSMSPMSAESAVIRNYIDWMLSLPWNKNSKTYHDIKKAKSILREDHYGLEDVKSRIIEYLSVRSLLKEEDGHATILCLAGPPGVGKTSIAKSLAESMGRRFLRISLGGVRDEAEIRGHRRTYVGALPGKIIQALKKAEVGNPLILLDEIDKMNSDFRGDPASAMLEVLDPEQNKNFGDHFLEVEYDLSKVMFVCTANDISQIQGPLRDRMEIINIAGYTPYEKLQIAKRYLLKKSTKSNGLEKFKINMGDRSLTKLIMGYSKEAGVRGVERNINAICRKIATEVVEKNLDPSKKKFKVTEKLVEKYLGPVKFDTHAIEQGSQIGLVNGLAYTSVGGEILHIEVVTVPGTGKTEITGKLGEVMQESVKAALSYVRSISDRLGVAPEGVSEHDIHIHVPEGATPKDGPSAGITLATALTSAVAGYAVKQDIAMTGEITIRGRVLPIGGLKEKLLAAKQAGVKTVIIPSKNEKDLIKIPKQILEGMDVMAFEEMEDVLRTVLDVKEEDFLKVVPNLKVVKGAAGKRERAAMTTLS
ncbi:MAG: endopeptidase La, partial [Bacteriovoracales bacterium]|nr:endopeptidase La [Bacteriovoracales bacterium]